MNHKDVHTISDPNGCRIQLYCRHLVKGAKFTTRYKKDLVSNNLFPYFPRIYYKPNNFSSFVNHYNIDSKAMRIEILNSYQNIYI